MDNKNTQTQHWFDITLKPKKKTKLSVLNDFKIYKPHSKSKNGHMRAAAKTAYQRARMAKQGGKKMTRRIHAVSEKKFFGNKHLA